jgi:hypothetical protein
MPRPLVEVRQAVLNPVITINDPQQEVCLIGLHTADFVDQEVNVLDLPGSVAQGDNVHVGAVAQHVFTIDAEGVFIDAAVDFGPDAYDISGDHTLKFSEAYISAKDIAHGYNAADAVAATTPDPSKLTFGEVANLATTVSAAGTDNAILVAQPISSYCNKLVRQGGASVNFITDSYFKNLGVGNEIVFPDSADTAQTYLILRKEADCIYLRHSDVASYAKLVSTINFKLLDPNVPANILGAMQDTTFSLVHPGIHESVITQVSTANAHDTLTLSTPLPFIIIEASEDELHGTIITKVAESDLDALKVSEVDDQNPLVIVVADDGDAAITVPSARMKDANNNIIARAKFTMSYTVAKNNLSASVASIDETTLTSVLGEASPRNPLRLAAELALLNSGSSRLNILSLDITPPDGTTVLRSVEDAFLNALSIVNRNSSMYAIVPLTVNATVTKAYANAAESLSAPTKGKFRICLGSSEGAPLLDFIIGSANTPALLGSNSNGTVTNLAGDMYRLPTSKVLEGDSIVATVGSVVSTGTVDSVSNTALTVTWDNDPGNVSFDSGYYVARSLAATYNIPRQIEILEAQAQAIASKRLFLTFPGSCTVASGDDLYAGLPSYYVTAAFSGLMSRVEIHRPKNYLGLAGIVGLQDFNRFDDDQLDQISDAGYLVFQQEEATSAPFCIHQVNTRHGVAAGTQEFTELSVLANFDFVSRYMKEVLDPFAGTMNIVPSTLGLIRSSLDAAMENLKARRTALIGAPLLSGSVEYVRQASFDQGTVEASILVSLPKVLNKIIIEVVSG